ncbi:DUF3574 domain-containing protein [Desulfovibrio sp. OttesenSCG-928-F20]|nr:DUF3574 domain-containing protein [Desulfovibrio sp. OttesenSCG-928-M16]MDL2291322.1 DUF3574 domain-containing protein [Desulfovibrio sp. OttesenSCG-928-F20]
MKRSFLALALFLALTAVAQAATAVQENIVLYRFHFGLGVGELAVGQQKMHAFVDEVITQAFPNGLTIFEARGQWRSPEHGLTRERTVVVDVQCADSDENSAAVERIAELYVERFKAARASVFITRVGPATATLYY